MPRDAGATSSEWIPEYVTSEAALRQFALTVETQGQMHIRPLHRHIALRLVLEGGFFPDEISPRPPVVHERRGGRHLLSFDEAAASDTELTVIGGLKTKIVDVVVTKQGLGPVLAVSVKGTGGAFRNLTNRMEEAIGDCTNLHIMYPGLVYGFVHLLKGNRDTQPGIVRNDVCIMGDRDVVPSVVRYADILAGLSGRRFVRDDFTRYEAVALVIVESADGSPGGVFDGFPSAGSPLHARRFFSTLYDTYDLRYPYMATTMRIARRAAWEEGSPAFAAVRARLGPGFEAALGYPVRLS